MKNLTYEEAVVYLVLEVGDILEKMTKEEIDQVVNSFADKKAGGLYEN